MEQQSNAPSPECRAQPGTARHGTGTGQGLGWILLQRNQSLLFISICDSQTFSPLLNCQFPEKPFQSANRMQNYDLATGYNWEK